MNLPTQGPSVLCLTVSNCPRRRPSAPASGHVTQRIPSSDTSRRKHPGSPRQSWEGAGLQSEVCAHARHLRVIPGVRRFLLLKSQGVTCTRVPNAAPAGVRLCPDTCRTRCSHRHMRDTRAHRHAHGHAHSHADTHRHTRAQVKTHTGRVSHLSRRHPQGPCAPCRS